MSDDGVVELPPQFAEQQEQRITAEKAESLPRRIIDGPVLTPQGEYIPVEWDGANTSGMKPMGDSVLLLPDQPRPVTAGGIELPDQLIERLAYAAETGVIVEVGDGAWAWNADRTRKFEGERPKPGTRVWFERYAGALPHGVDGLIYRLVTDKQIGAVAIGIPDTHEQVIDEASGKTVVRRKQSTDAPREPPAAPAGTKTGDAPIADAAKPSPKPKQERQEPPAWPRYLMKSGNMLMAFSQADANEKAPGEVWWATKELAEMRAT